MSSSCRIVAETWLRIPTKRTGEDYAIIIMTMIMIIVIRAAQDQALRTNVIKAISNIRTCQCRAGCVENARRV